MISARLHISGDETLLAACDMTLLGQEFRDGRLKLVVSRDFYEGMEVDTSRFLELMGAATMANLVGEETVGAAVDGGFVDRKCVLHVAGVPHAQMVLYEV